MNKINNKLINPLTEFSSEQLNIYEEKIKKLNEINDNYKEQIHQIYQKIIIIKYYINQKIQIYI